MEINVLQVLFQIINFGVVFGALTYFLTKPVTKMLDDRRNSVQEGAKAAEESLRERESIEAMKKKSKTQAEKEAEKILEEARADAKELKNKLAKEVKEEVAALRAQELAKAADEKKARLQEMEKEIGKLSLEIASKVLGEEVDEKKHHSLITSSIRDIAKAL